MQMLGTLMVIAALGDSVTVGPAPVRGRKPGPAFVEILARQLGEAPLNAGVAADTSTRMLARIDKTVLARRPRVVLVMAGLNDAAWVDPGPKARNQPRVSEVEFERSLTAIVERVKKAKAAPVLLTPNPMTRAYKFQNMPFYQENDINDGLAPYVDATRRVARTTGACLVDVFADWQTRREHRRWIPDGLHPNAEGHRLIAAKVMEACGAVVKPSAGRRALQSVR
jgi:lysophospholipase L1-like esterase